MMLTTLLPRIEHRYALAGAGFGSLLPAVCLLADSVLSDPAGESLFGLSAPTATALALMPVFFAVGFFQIGRSKAQLLAELAQRRLSEERLQHDACHDRLTGLANRLCLERDIQAAVDAGDPDAWPALLLLDLDRFKHVNDSLGHGTGDALLSAIAARLRQALSPTGQVYRLGGDEFVVTVAGRPSQGKVEDVCRTIVTLFETPFDLDGREVSSGCSIGATFMNSGDRSMTELLDRADIALYRAKEQTGTSYRFHEAALSAGTGVRTAAGRDPSRPGPRRFGSRFDGKGFSGAAFPDCLPGEGEARWDESTGSPLGRFPSSPSSSPSLRAG